MKVIPGNQLDPNTAQSPGMSLAAAIDFARAGNEDPGALAGVVGDQRR